MTSPDDVRRTLDGEPDLIPVDDALAALDLVAVVAADGERYITRSSLARAQRRGT